MPDLTEKDESSPSVWTWEVKLGTCRGGKQGEISRNVLPKPFQVSLGTQALAPGGAVALTLSTALGVHVEPGGALRPGGWCACGSSACLGV